MITAQQAMPEFLSATELHGLTGYARPGQQAQWLKEQGIPHKVDGRRVIVSRVHSRQWLEGRAVVISEGINFGAVK